MRHAKATTQNQCRKGNRALNLAGEVALVTGAGKGIGRAIAQALADLGVAVAVNSFHEKSARAACEELTEAGSRACAVPADVNDEAAVRKMVQHATAELGPIDILVNNAAAPAEFVPFVETTAEIREQEMVTFTGVLNCTRHVLEDMVARRSGRVINISSIGAWYTCVGRAVYGAAMGPGLKS